MFLTCNLLTAAGRRLRLKTGTAKAILTLQAGGIKSNFRPDNYRDQFWQHENHPVLLDNLKLYHQRLVYLYENPVRAGFVKEPQEWLYSSAIDYYITNGRDYWIWQVWNRGELSNESAAPLPLEGVCMSGYSLWFSKQHF